jgi:hypothetical protein
MWTRIVLESSFVANMQIEEFICLVCKPQIVMLILVDEEERKAM